MASQNEGGVTSTTTVLSKARVRKSLKQEVFSAGHLMPMAFDIKIHAKARSTAKGRIITKLWEAKGGYFEPGCD